MNVNQVKNNVEDYYEGKKIIESFHDNWEDISFINDLPLWFIKKYQNKLNWKHVSSSHDITKEFLDEFNHIIKWEHVGNWKQRVNFSSLDKYIDNLNLNNFLYFDNNMPLSFIIKYKNRMSWQKLCIYANLPEKFMIDNINNLDWKLISFYQKLSEQFIEKYKDKVDWSHIFSSQKMSYSFIKRNFRYPEIFSIFGNTEISSQIKNKISKLVHQYRIDMGIGID